MSRSAANACAVANDLLPTAAMIPSVPLRTPGTNARLAIAAVLRIPHRNFAIRPCPFRPGCDRGWSLKSSVGDRHRTKIRKTQATNTHRSHVCTPTAECRELLPGLHPRPTIGMRAEVHTRAKRPCDGTRFRRTSPLSRSWTGTCRGWRGSIRTSRGYLH